MILTTLLPVRRARRTPARLSMVFAGLLLVSVLSSIGRPAAAAEVRTILHPVAVGHLSQVHWTDTWGAPRSGGRSHIGVDIMGPKMTPLVAVADGTVSWMRHDGRGNILEITDDEGWSYFYVHINNDTPGTDDGANAFEHAFAPGIARGVRVQAGQVVAYLGDSGNAEWTGSHLHFEIARPDGTPINPTASVDAAVARLREMPALDASLLGPYRSGDELVADVFGTLGSERATDERLTFAHQVAEIGLARALQPYVSGESRAAAIDRLYVAFFHRLPDIDGYEYWIDREDLSLARMADFFADSEEYRTRYGGLDFAQFLDLLYQDVLGRAPDEGGKAYWLARLADPDDPVTRGTIVSYFTQSPELRGLAEHRNEVVALTALVHDRMPTGSEIERWQAARAARDLPSAAELTFLS